MTNTLRLLFLSGALTAAALLTGCAGTQYVDTATKEVPVSAMKKVAQAKPTQVTFEFMTKGAPNAAATKLLKDAVLLQVQESGLFAPSTPGSAMLTISLNNIPLTDNASRQGFVTGLTFGLAGSAVTDGYVCTLSYLPAGQSTPIVKTARHAIHTTLGNANPPPGAGAPVDGITAVKTMTRDIVSNALRDLSNDPTFN
jgi:hypothetical protein